MNIIRQELKNNRRSIIIWTLSSALFMAFVMLEFDAYHNNPELLEIVDVLPKELIEMFGLGNLNLSQLDGFLKLALVYGQLVGAVYAMMLGINSMLKEILLKTTEFILVMPIKREKLIINKVVANAILMLVLVVGMMVSLALSGLPYGMGSDEFKLLGLAGIAIYGMMFLLLSLGMLLTAIFKPKKSLSLIGLLLVFGAYIFNVMINLLSRLDYLRWISPFAWFDIASIHSEGFNIYYMILALLLIIISLLLTLNQYQKRSIV